MTENGYILVYDGTFNGFLTAIFTAFENRLHVIDIQTERNSQNVLFAEPYLVSTQTEKARRVWNGIENKQYQAAKKIYFAFLSERKDIEFLLFRYITNLFKKPGEANDAVELKVESVATQVELEKKSLETSLRFQQQGGDVDIAMINSRFNILPLISKHFRSLMPHGAWMLYDQKRNYGLYYHHHKMEVLELGPEEASLLCAGSRVSYLRAGRTARVNNNDLSPSTASPISFQANSAA